MCIIGQESNYSSNN